MSYSALRSLPLLASFVVLGVGCTVEAPACRVDPEHVDERRTNSICIVRSGSRVLAIVNRLSGKLDLPGGRREGDETGQCTAHRELWEETGIDARTGVLRDWGLENLYDIYPHYLHRYPPGVTRNRERVFGLTVSAGT